jgi:predicted O-methyltransferase YrrM
MMARLQRALRRIRYESGLDSLGAWAGDAGRETLFRLRASERERLRARLARCRDDLDALFDFAAEQFGPHQIRQEILAFLVAATAERPSTVLEIGTAAGGTSFLLGNCLPTVTARFGIDLHVRNRARLRALAPEGQEVWLRDGSSRAPETVRAFTRALGPRRLDLLFIDGDHRYEGVRRDFLEYSPLVREGGLIAFHDVVPDRLTREGVQSTSWVGGVPRFWATVKAAYPAWEFIADPNQDGFGIGVLRYCSKASPVASV